MSGFWGIAPARRILAGNVYGDNPHASQVDLANGILTLAEDHKVDLINLSQGSPIRSLILLDAIQQALDVGCLCICAVGNSQGAVQWPARARSCVAVSAVGRHRSAPSRTRSAKVSITSRNVGQDLFFASFSCYGDEVDCCGPGVGVISTVPQLPGLHGHFWAPMDGTSMAAPSVCGLLAALLSRSRKYRSSPRTRDRAKLARRLLQKSCRRQIGLEQICQGDGMPFLEPRLIRRK